MIKAVVFDMDGVLFDTEHQSLDNWLAYGKELGLSNMEEVHTACIGLNRNDGIQLLKQSFGEDFDGEGFLNECSRRMHQQWRENGLPVMKGVREMLSFLKEKNISTAICSSTRMSTIREHLQQTQLEDFFDQIIGGDMVEHSKPQPDIYLKACEALNLPPEECMGVEDSPNGIRSCAAAGLCTVMIPDLVTPSEEIKALTDRIENSMFDLLEYWKNDLMK